MQYTGAPRSTPVSAHACSAGRHGPDGRTAMMSGTASPAGSGRVADRRPRARRQRSRTPPVPSVRSPMPTTACIRVRPPRAIRTGPEQRPPVDMRWCPRAVAVPRVPRLPTGVQVPWSVRQRSTQHCKRCQLRRVGLRCRHGDFGAGRSDECDVDRRREWAVRSVGDADGAGAAARGPTWRRRSVRRCGLTARGSRPTFRADRASTGTASPLMERPMRRAVRPRSPTSIGRTRGRVGGSTSEQRHAARAGSKAPQLGLLRKERVDGGPDRDGLLTNLSFHHRLRTVRLRHSASSRIRSSCNAARTCNVAV